MCLLGSLMLDKNAIIKVVDFLQPRDFYKGNHQTIYKAMQKLFERSDPIDLLSVASSLREMGKLEEAGGNTYLAELINTVPTATHVANYAKIVQKKRILRDLIDASYEIGVMGYNESEDVDQLLDAAEKRIFSIAQHSLTQNFIPVKSTLNEAFERMDMLSKHGGQIRGLPTGFVDLDNMLAGFQKSDLILLASRPSMGKSALAIDVARNVAVYQKTPVGIFSLEMSKDQIVDRLIAAQAGVDLWKLRTGKLSSEDFQRIQQALGILSEAPIFIDDAATANILQMRAMARRLQADKGLGLIVVDYLQLMEPRNANTSEVQQVTEISRSLKGLARELNTPVLALSQLSRAVEMRTPPRPRLADLRQSGCLTGDTLITNADNGERVPIKDIAEGRVNTPFPVFAVDESYKIGTYRMVKAFYSGRKTVYELKTRGGNAIKASANHKFLTINGWQRLDQLKPGDCIALPKRFQVSNCKNLLSDRELVLLAHLLGDGCILPRQPFHYTSADIKNIETVRNAAKTLFSVETKLVKQKNWFHLYLSSPYRLTHGKHHPITNWYKKLGIGLVHSWDKKIPAAVFGCDNKRISLFLKHLWSTDGNLSWKKLSGRKPAGNIYYATSSLIMAQQIQSLLSRLGIGSSLRKNHYKKQYRPMYHIVIEGSREQLSFMEKVGIAGKKGKIVKPLTKALKKIVPNPNIDVIPQVVWESVIEPIAVQSGVNLRELQKTKTRSWGRNTLFNSGISRERMQKIASVLNSPVLDNLANSDISWEKIASIEKLGIENVYDATVENVHNFVANDIIVHNSLEQDADVVLFIYREKQRGEEIPQNITEIIIAKHRNGPIGATKLYFDAQKVSFRNLEKYQEEAEIF